MICQDLYDLSRFLFQDTNSTMQISSVYNYNFASNGSVGVKFSDPVYADVKYWDLTKIELWDAPNGDLGAANFAQAVKLGTLAAYSRNSGAMYYCRIGLDMFMQTTTDPCTVCFKPGANLGNSDAAKLVKILSTDNRNLYIIFREGAIKGTDGYSYPASAEQWAGYRGAASSSFGIGMPS